MKTRTYFSLFHKNFGLLLLLAMVVIALFSWDEYGLSWDENQQRETGIVSYNYLFSEDSRLFDWNDRDYGVALELPLILVEKVFDLTDTRSIYLMRHLVSHLFFLLGCYFLYLLIYYLYKNKLLATIGFLMLIINPRLYSHSFFNTKDIPFMSLFIISIYYSVKAFDKKTVVNFIKLGICIGLLINLRIMGIIMPALIILALIIDSIKDAHILPQLKFILIFILSSCLTLYITWPFLWSDPINNFVFAFENMSKFRWEYFVLFNGAFIKSTELSWTYIPTWFSITTPIIYLILGLFGSLLIIYQFIRTPFSFCYNSIKRQNLLFLIYFLAPVISVIVLHSVLYDGWRQLYFIYPSFVLLIIYGLSSLYKKNINVFKTVLSLLIISFTITSVYMIRSFPVQTVYFNNFFSSSPAEYIRKNFELDYWGVSYKQSLEYLLTNDSASSINVHVSNAPGIYNIDILPPSDRVRIKIVPMEEATYFITNYRGHPEDYNKLGDYKFHSIKVGNNTVSQIFKLK